MNIENSPFYITKSKGIETNKPLSKNTINKQPINKTEQIQDSSSFWDWFRGLVNPLQNLPIISGIYSSMNSEDSNSDRDLVQNSLGGFMYGGPIGAIAGFGNWVFNKLFDKTPTELALDFTGISNIWKDDENSKDEVKVASSDLGNKNIDSKSLGNNSGEWWKKSQFVSIESNNKNFESHKTKIKKEGLSVTNSGNSPLIENNKLAELSNRYKSNDHLKPKLSDTLSKKINVSSDNIKNTKENYVLDSINKEVPENQQIELKEKKKFREINFDYPVWKPDTLEISKNKLENRNLVNKKYLESKKDPSASTFNINL